MDKYRPYVPLLCRILRALLQPGLSPEHDVGGITNPFLQVGVCGAAVGMCVFFRVIPVGATLTHPTGAQSYGSACTGGQMSWGPCGMHEVTTCKGTIGKPDTRRTSTGKGALVNCLRAVLVRGQGLQVVEGVAGGHALCVMRRAVKLSCVAGARGHRVHSSVLR